MAIDPLESDTLYLGAGGRGVYRADLRQLNLEKNSAPQCSNWYVILRLSQRNGRSLRSPISLLARGYAVSSL